MNTHNLPQLIEHAMVLIASYLIVGRVVVEIIHEIDLRRRPHCDEQGCVLNHEWARTKFGYWHNLVQTVVAWPVVVLMAPWVWLYYRTTFPVLIWLRRNPAELRRLLGLDEE